MRSSRDAERREPLRDRLRRREAHVGLLVEPADDRLDDRPHHRQPGHARRVLGDLGVVLRDHRQAEHARRDQAGDARSARRRDLDEVRRARRATRSAPAARARSTSCRDRSAGTPSSPTGCARPRRRRRRFAGADEVDLVAGPRVRGGDEPAQPERDAVDVIDRVGDDRDARSERRRSVTRRTSDGARSRGVASASSRSRSARDHAARTRPRS